MDERSTADDAVGEDDLGAGVADPWGVPSVVHLRGAGASLLLLAEAPDAPRVLHWGGDLGDLSVDETEALALAASAGAGDGAAPGSPLLLGPTDLQDEDADVGGPGLLVTAAAPGAVPPPVTLVRTAASLGVTATGSQRLVVRAQDAALGVRVTTEVELDAAGVLRLGATAAARPDGPVRLRGLRLLLPVPDVGRQVLLDVGGRLRPARSLRPTSGPPASAGRRGDAVVVQTAGPGTEELWAMATAAGRGARAGAAPRAVRAARLPGGPLGLVVGADASAADGVLRWTTPAVVAVHGRSWPDVRRRLDAALGPG